ncbi:MAG: hypothetical protein CMD32_02710 [Flavobacteriales bacterium]|nr:hypothetical protein [Flavobacteriales bacterium]
MVNLLYCLDENYNYQALTSIISILDKSSLKINLYVIHKNLHLFKNVPKIIKKHKNLNKLEIFEFGKVSNHFPNISNSHISEATYYRLFIENILPKEVEEIIYIDCDIIAINPIDNNVSDIFRELKISDNTIAVKTEFKRNMHKNLFKDLNLKGEKYFNAGIMFIDLEKWRKIEINHKAEKIIEDDNIEFKFWDQDILNILFDGDYLELEKKFNYAVDVENFSVNKNSIKDKAVLIHYSGSKKPWTVEGLLNNTSNFYQENYRKLGFEKIHITHKWKKYSTLLFLKNILNLRLQKNYKTVELLKSFYRSLNSKRIKK